MQIQAISTADIVNVIPAGSAAIVPRIIPVAGMEVGVNRGITVPADVPVNLAGEAAIVPRIIPVAGMEVGLS